MGSTVAENPPNAREDSLEGKVFKLSPFGVIPTSALLFVLLAGSYALLATLLHISVFHPSSNQMFLESGVYQAAVLALLVATVLGIQRYQSIRETADEPAFAAISSNAAASASILHPISPVQMRWATFAGLLIGIALASVMIPVSALHDHPALYAWHFCVTVFLGTLFGRGVIVTARGGRAFSHMIEHELRIDLLHIDRLSVIGRHSARNALIWFVCAAVVCLFFVGSTGNVEYGGVNSTTFLIIIVCAGLGLWIFFRPMEHVHRRIRAAKSAELDRIRNEIEKARDGAVHDASAATLLQGLLAYEARIQAVHEWPFDQSTMMRVTAYVLIPAIPWFGEAVVSDMVQRLAHW